MQFEMSQSCPLCRRTLPASVVELAPGSRLCGECRSIVQEAFPVAASRLSVPTAIHQNQGSMAVAHQGAPVLDLPPIDTSEFIEDGSSIDSFDQEAEFSSPKFFELNDDLKSDPGEGEEPDAWERTVEPEFDMSEDGSSQAKAAIAKHSVETARANADYPKVGAGAFHSPEQAATSTEPVSADRFDDHADWPQPTKQEAATDPWEDPLPSWEYSKSEWPVLAGPPSRRRNKFGLLRTSLVALVLLAAGGFYFFILKPTLREPRRTVPVDSKEAERAEAAAQPNVSEAKSTEPGPRPEASLPSSVTPAIVDPKPIQLPEDANTHGKFSLQAAAFPTQAGADEFAEKLKRAGLPSYIASADLGRRGRWFRVRVGRFNSVDDAQKFAAEAQNRAKAAGMSLQLIGCQYDQP